MDRGIRIEEFNMVSHNRETHERKRSLIQDPLIGSVVELADVFGRGFYSLPRHSIPWEKFLPVRMTFLNAIAAVKSEIDPALAAEIFGEGGGEVKLQTISVIGKGWNTVVASFELPQSGDDSEDNKEMVVKIGAIFSPDSFYANPSSRKFANEMKKNLEIITDAADKVNLPKLVSHPQAIAYGTFKNWIGIKESRTVHIMPKEAIVPLQSIFHLPAQTREQLLEEFRKYRILRSDLIANYGTDFDLDDITNVGIVRDSDGSYHLRIVDYGMRDHGTNKPLADTKLDVKGSIHSIRLDRALKDQDYSMPAAIGDLLTALLWGNSRRGRDVKALLSPIIDGRGLRREIRASAGYLWDQLPRFAQRRVAQYLGIPIEIIEEDKKPDKGNTAE